MRVAFEAPIGNTRFALEKSDYIFAIAPMLKIPEYAEEVKRAREQGKELHIDNGVYEGQLMGVDEYLELCYEWKPDVVVLPDVLLNGGATVDLTSKFFHRAKGNLPFKTMFVLQGRDDTEKLRGYELVGECADIIGLGLGAFEKDWRARICFFAHAWEARWNYHIHILGIANLADLCFWSAFAESCDTSLPFHAAHDGVEVLDEKKKSTRLDWFDTLEGERLRLAARNVELVRRVLK